MNKNDPAFPVIINDDLVRSYTGLSIRQYYAAKAMQGMITHYIPSTEDKDKFVKAAFEMADAMIAFEENEK